MAEVAGKGGSVAEEKNLPYHVIQTHIILNDWPGHFSLPLPAVNCRVADPGNSNKRER
jgi:hypothetical protein